MVETNFSEEIIKQLDDADQWCSRHGQRLTKTRRQVLGLVLSEKQPSGAYDILSRLRQWQPRAVPPTVYRALDFLLEHGLVHRIERLSAFVGCRHALKCGGGCREHGTWGVHRAQFLICRQCQQVEELEQDVVATVLLSSARAYGFQAEAATVEIEGLCARCHAQLAH
ncbi:transcriptional repressor [Saccharibacter sp. 17.LH.SD]|uniref:Fur family transcriptional regulator n=1 Tax=Saccharibacter sp. 17.LH.SD TaxID=2689393 RepID=UPI00136F3853|nr:Fur family transcriptional regulator [Saccharibacter sp. 17.LH.SD]MXV43751.1 transcriptional repressor [Saccharibacter sp. 17.LH.SD]